MDFIINSEELDAICGLPHIQQLTYLRAIRPFLDGKTGLVGIKRRISYQSISEQLYIEPHQGIKSQSFSRDQVRRAVSGLVRAGVIEAQSERTQLILKCLLATRYFPVQNKAAIKPPQKATANQHVESLLGTGLSQDRASKVDTLETSKAATPLIETKYIYLLSQFEQFWSIYPEKKSMDKAQEAFLQLNPDTSLFQRIIEALRKQINHVEALRIRGTWVPPWKYPANWLAQRCWKDELFMEPLQETSHAKHTKNTRKCSTTTDPFSPPPESNNESKRTNVIPFR